MVLILASVRVGGQRTRQPWTILKKWQEDSQFPLIDVTDAQGWRDWLVSENYPETDGNDIPLGYRVYMFGGGVNDLYPGFDEVGTRLRPQEHGRLDINFEEYWEE